MDGPFPPNERWWRHPSELAAPPPEPTTGRGRLLIASTAIVSVGLVVMLVAFVLPATGDRNGTGANPLVLGGEASPQSSFGHRRAAGSGVLHGAPLPAVIGTADAGVAAAAAPTTAPVEVRVTPIGANVGIATVDAVGPSAVARSDTAATFMAQLPTGSTVSARVLDVTDDGVALVGLDIDPAGAPLTTYAVGATDLYQRDPLAAVVAASRMPMTALDLATMPEGAPVMVGDVVVGLVSTRDGEPTIVSIGPLDSSSAPVGRNGANDTTTVPPPGTAGSATEPIGSTPAVAGPAVSEPSRPPTDAAPIPAPPVPAAPAAEANGPAESGPSCTACVVSGGGSGGG